MCMNNSIHVYINGMHGFFPFLFYFISFLIDSKPISIAHIFVYCLWGTLFCGGRFNSSNRKANEVCECALTPHAIGTHHRWHKKLGNELKMRCAHWFIVNATRYFVKWTVISSLVRLKIVRNWATRVSEISFSNVHFWCWSVNFVKFHVHVNSFEEKQRKNHGKIGKKFNPLFANISFEWFCTVCGCWKAWGGKTCRSRFIYWCPT